MRCQGCSTKPLRLAWRGVQRIHRKDRPGQLRSTSRNPCSTNGSPTISGVGDSATTYTLTRKRWMEQMACDSDPHKEIERQHLHSFQYLCTDFPAGELSDRRRNTGLSCRNSVWAENGIEHTQVFKTDGTDETTEQADEATKECIKEKAKRHAEALGLPPAHVMLFFNPQYLRRSVGSKRSFTKAERQKIAEQ